MKKTKILVVILMVAMTCFILSACMEDEKTLIYLYDRIGETQDEIPLNYVAVSVIVSNSETGVEFVASDFSIIRNGVKVNGTAFITGVKLEQNNEDKTYTSITKLTYLVKNNEGAELQIVFASVDNITELYHKNEKIELK